MSIDAQFVPRDQSDVDRLHAFRLLAHAEIQHYIDMLAQMILDKTQDRATNEGVLTHAGHHLLVYYALEPLGTPRDAPNARYPEFIPAIAVASRLQAPARLTKAIQRHQKLIEFNNGLKAGNVRRVLVPIGYREDLFATGMLDQLDNLGAARGDVAHGSGVIGFSSWPSGSTEWTRLRLILPGLDALERYAPRLLRAAHG
ncbi:hypothetical protein [Cellulomonas septica]|uniref:Uncharacterized protein n=1 Tax=Cellulomonas septica TaxID=285080 RepID=A0ABX1JWJ6_9CELL|nr:hypothetical protein [Cellulomonas septica]NKY38160.1 hypothetical protein [Cellulomonas septica]